jgi:hypothetical protein
LLLWASVSFQNIRISELCRCRESVQKLRKGLGKVFHREKRQSGEKCGVFAVTSVVSKVLTPPVMNEPLDKSYSLPRKTRVKCRASVGLAAGSPHSLTNDLHIIHANR